MNWKFTSIISLGILSFPLIFSLIKANKFSLIREPNYDTDESFNDHPAKAFSTSSWVKSLKRMKKRQPVAYRQIMKKVHRIMENPFMGEYRSIDEPRNKIRPIINNLRSGNINVTEDKYRVVKALGNRYRIAYWIHPDKPEQTLKEKLDTIPEDKKPDNPITIIFYLAGVYEDVYGVKMNAEDSN